MADNAWNNALADNDGNNAGNWSLGWVPKAGDRAVYDDTSAANCTLSADDMAPDALWVVGGGDYTGTIDFAGHTVGVGAGGGTGAVNIGEDCSIADSGGGGEIRCVGNFLTTVPLPSGLTITIVGNADVTTASIANNANMLLESTITATCASLAYWKSLTVTAGTYDMAGYAHRINGNITGAGTGVIGIDTADVILGGAFEQDGCTVNTANEKNALLRMPRVFRCGVPMAA